MLNGLHLNNTDSLPKIASGTTQFEVVQFQLLLPVSILLRNIAVPWIFLGRRFGANNGFWLKFLLDFSFLVLPVVLCMTILSSHIALVLTLELIAVISLIIFLLCEYTFISREKPTFKCIFNEVIDENLSPTIFITYLRSSVLLATAIAILAVDFRVFPRRFAKTEKYGRSVMDIGVASFIFCSALVDASRGTYATFVSHLTKSTPRTVIINLLRYPHEVSEYGVHWNFFFTLAAVQAFEWFLEAGRIFIKLVRKILGKRFHLLYGLFFTFLHQMLLNEYKFEDWLLSDTTPRDNFLLANREGIFSLLGYCSFYYLSLSISIYAFSKGIRLKSWFCRTVQLFVIAVVLFIIQQYVEFHYGLPSRRIVNISYVFEMLVLHTLMLGELLLVQFASLFGWAAKMPQFSTEENPFEQTKPCLMESINKHGLMFFLLANASTGVINVLVATGNIYNDMLSAVIVLLYMLLITTVIYRYSKYSA
uniref:Phosphatidylinositol-glycan biosynthesis class W protein n=1 Tax=Syphacia muris TaxID=451379 RepID=A0A0N5ALE1_9BILA